jgi:hypothetical protein
LCIGVHLPVNLVVVNYAGLGAQTTERMMVAAEGAWTLAFNRFGLGARPGAAVRSGDPRQALLAELSAEEGADRTLRSPFVAKNPASRLRRRLAPQAGA